MIETRHLKNIIFFQTILSFALSRKIKITTTTLIKNELKYFLFKNFYLNIYELKYLSK